MTVAPFDPRVTWGARPPKRPLPVYFPPNLRGTAWHYIGGAGRFAPASHTECLAWVRALQAREMGVFATIGRFVKRKLFRRPLHASWSYNDISYNLCCCPHGRVIEGRGIFAQSGAQLGGNDTYEGVLLMMNVDDVMTPELDTAARWAHQLILDRYPTATVQLGHQDVAGNPTHSSCPGIPGEAWVHAGGATSPNQPTPTPQEDDVPAIVISPFPGTPKGRDAFARLVPELGIVTLHNGARLTGDQWSNAAHAERIWIPPRGHATLTGMAATRDGQSIVVIGSDPAFGDVTFRTAWAQ